MSGTNQRNRGWRGGCCQSKGCGWVSCCLWVVNGPSHHWRCSCVGNFFSAIQQWSFNWFWSICKWQQMMIGKTKTDDHSNLIHSPIPPNQSNSISWDFFLKQDIYRFKILSEEPYLEIICGQTLLPADQLHPCVGDGQVLEVNLIMIRIRIIT